MDEAKEKGDSVSTVSGSSVTVSETVVETMACEDRIRIKEGGEAGLGNGDDVTVEVLDSHVHIDGGDGGAVQARSIDEAVCGHQEFSKVGLEVNMRTLDSECHAVGGLGSRNEVLGGEARAQNEVNGGVVWSCSNDVVCGRDESDEVGLEGNPSTVDSEGDLAGDLGSRYEVSGGEAKAWTRVLRFSALDSSAGKNAEQSSGINEGGGDLNQAKETGKVGNLDSYELNHGNQKRVVCLSAASEDSGVQTKIVEEAAMAIDEEDLIALDGGQETPISELIKKAANVGVDATSLNVNTLVTAECVPGSEAKDPVYSCQSTGSIAAGQLDEKVSSNMEIDKQGTDYEQQQMEVKTPHLSTQKHDTGNVQSLKPEPIIDGGEGVGLSTGEAVLAEKQVSDAKEVGFDAEQDVKVEKMGVSPKNRDPSDVSESLGHQMDVFVGSGEVEAAKVDNNVLNQISPAVASDKELQLSGNEDPLAKNVVSEDDSSVEQEMNVEDQVTSDEPDCLEQVEEMEVVEHDSDSDQPTNVDYQTVKQTALKSLSGVKMHQAQQLLSEEEGGFSVSDLVWGKVKSHPWWPGQIFDPSDASKKAVKYQKKDSFLVAYFGDRTFAWNEPSVLKPFRTHFSQIVKQSNLESFENAVNCALEEVSRRVELGLACPCIPKDAYDRIKFQKVENTGVREESSLRDGVDVSLSVSSFEPDKLIDYMKELAESPYSGGDRIDLVIAKAQLLAFYRLKGYHQLPESQFSEEKRLEVVDCATPMDTDGEQKSEASKSRRRSYLKRKHNLKDGLYPSKKERSLSELMSETFDSPDGEIGSDVIGNKPPSSSFGKKRKAIDSSEDSVMQEGRKTSKGSLSTPHFPKPSFKIGERISRAASQMTGSPSILKSSGDRLQKLDGGCETPATCGYDVPIDNLEDAERKRMGILTEYSSLDELLLQLHLAACDPMKGYSSLNIIISFFSDFRDSIVLDRLSRDKAVGQRKKSPNSIIGFSETFEFEDMSDTYWTDRIVQNGSEEQPSVGTDRGQYQFVPVELDKPIQKVRKSRKRYSDTSHDLTAQKPPGYVDEKAPAEIVMSFPEINSVPSETKLNKMFKHFGPLKESETEVDCETSRARVVFRRSSDAEVAYNSARKFNIFGLVSVTYQLNYTISESFKASLYAPTLAEENPFIASAPCGDHALIAPSLGEEASFMVSTLGEETLPIASTFHEEPWFIASTTGEDTLAIPTTLADGASDVATTMYEKTLPVTTTAGVETMADATIIVDKTFTVATTVGEQSLPVFTTIDEQTSTAAASLVDEASFSHLTLSKRTSTLTATLGDQTSSIATFHPEIPSVPATVGEETCSIPAPSAEETRILPNLDAETPIHPVTLAEETPSISIAAQPDSTSTSSTLYDKSSSTKMKGIFKSKPRTPVDIVRQTRDLLSFAARSSESRESKREEKMAELFKNLRELKSILYGNSESEPVSEACAQLTQEFFRENTLRLLITCLPKLNLEARKDATQVVANLQRQQVNSRLIASDYLEANLDLLDILIAGYENTDMALHYGAMLRECIRHQTVARYVLESQHMKKFFDYIQLPKFDIAADAAATFKELLTRHKSTVAEFLSKNYDWFFAEYNSKLLESSNYITRRQAIKLLGDILLDRSNAAVMTRYVSSKDNLRILMNLLRESSKSIQIEAFHVFKLFAAKQNKPPDIVSILVANKSKLLRLFADFKTNKEDEQFEADKAQVVREIAALELRDGP